MNANLWLEPWGIYLDEMLEIDAITDQSNKVKKGTAFFALKGFSVDGNDYIEDALQNGASLVITSIPSIFPRTIVIPQLQELLSEIVYRFYGHPEKHLRFIGITGTNGKTSTSWIIYHAFLSLGIRPLMVGTLGAYSPYFEEQTTNTTPGVFFLANLFHRAVNFQIQWVVMEVSSHALMLGRVEQLRFDFAIFLNLSHDHLDFHLTLESYYQAKKKLFSQIRESSLILINGDDSWGDRLSHELPHKCVTFGQSAKSDIICTAISTLLHEGSYNIQGVEFETSFIHPINGYNFAASFGVFQHLGYEKEAIIQAFTKVPPVPGRFQYLKVQNRNVIIDFAHTPDAMEKVLVFLRNHTQNQLITVFGCGGNRDAEKRPIMGHIASTYSDYVVITSDNPRFEDPNSIVADILKGQKGNAFKVLIDRRKAIETAMNFAQSGDFVAILGKGNETYQITGDQKEPYQDIEEVNKWLNR